jgi:hypothetical protein
VKVTEWESLCYATRLKAATALDLMWSSDNEKAVRTRLLQGRGSREDEEAVRMRQLRGLGSREGDEAVRTKKPQGLKSPQGLSARSAY